jgi:hypothetical protein
MIEFSIIGETEVIPAGNYYNRDKVLDLVSNKYGYKYTFLDYLTLPFISIMPWYGEYIRLDNFTSRIGEGSLEYIKQNLEPKVVEEVKYERVFDKIIDGLQYIIEERVYETHKIYNVLSYDQTGYQLINQSFADLDNAKVYLLNKI